MNDSYAEELGRAYQGAVGAAWRPNVCPGAAKCKLCALIRPILNFQGPGSDEALVQQAKDMQAKDTYYSNICFDPDYSKVILFSYGKNIMDDLARYQIGPTSDYADFAHPTNGRLIVVQKSIGSNGRNQYSATPRVAVHKLPGIPEPHNIKQIVQLLSQGVEYYPQSKLEVKETTVRFIGYGVEGTRFFKTVKLHWSISPDEYALVQQGQYNPFNVADVDSEPETVSERDVPMFETPMQTGEGLSPGPAVEPEASEGPPVAGQILTGGQGYEGQPTEVEPVVEEASPSQPPCFGREYDPQDGECKKCITFAAACQEKFIAKYGG